MVCNVKVFSVPVFNIPDHVERYVVARLVDGMLWFWGCWNDKRKAEKACEEINGVLVYTLDN